MRLNSGRLLHVQRATGGSIYVAASSLRLLLNLGKRAKIDSLEITWPSGQVDCLTHVPIDQIIAIREGTGIVPHLFPKVPSR